MKRLVVLLALAAFAVGCGGGGDGSEGASGKAKSAESARAGEDFDAIEGEVGQGRSAAFRSGFTTCQLYPLEELARQNSVKADPEAVATAIAAFETSAKEKKDVHDGCLEALKVG